MDELTVLVPTRGRPASLATQLTHFDDTRVTPVRYLPVIDADDPELPGYLDLQVPHLLLPVRHNLIAKLNIAATMYAPTARHLGFLGDDHVPRTAGWDAAVLAALRDRPIVYPNDLFQGPNLPTAVFLRSEIVSALGFMAPPVLTHYYCDNFWLSLGRDIGIRYLPEVIVEHVHHEAGKAVFDATYQLSQPHRQSDAEAFAAYAHTQYPADRERVLRALGRPSGRPDLTEDFHARYYGAEHTWQDSHWLGTPVLKCPLDLWVYQEIVHRVRPDFIIEAGTFRGGTAHFLACLCELIGHGEVLSIDISPRADRPGHERLRYLTGSSVDSAIIDGIAGTVRAADTVLVILDSDHSYDHVLREIEAYSELVSVGSYLIVEDTNLNGNPVWPTWGPGPREAVETFLARSPDFQRDHTMEKHLLTFNPGGYLRRIG